MPYSLIVPVDPEDEYTDAFLDFMFICAILRDFRRKLS